CVPRALGARAMSGCAGTARALGPLRFLGSARAIRSARRARAVARAGATRAARAFAATSRARGGPALIFRRAGATGFLPRLVAIGLATVVRDVEARTLEQQPGARRRHA